MLSKKGYMYIMIIIRRLYFFTFIYRLSRYFLIPNLYFGIKMAISYNKQTRLLEVITYPLYYLNCGFSLKVSFFLSCVVRFTISLSGTSFFVSVNKPTNLKMPKFEYYPIEAQGKRRVTACFP